MSKRLYSGIIMIAVVTLAAGCGKTVNVTRPNGETKTPVAAVNEHKPSSYSYQGQTGKTALQLLKDKHTVETKQFSGIGEFVESIDGVKPDDSHFWSLYINGQPSQVGADQYQTKDTDTLEWKMETITK